MRPIDSFTLPLLLASAVQGSVLMRRDAHEDNPASALIHPRGLREDKLAKLDETWKKFSVLDFCNKYDPQKRPDDAAKLWKEFGIEKWFDNWLDATESEDIATWAQVMDKEMHQNGQSQFNCKNFDDNCHIPGNCQTHYNNGMGPAYWILNSASRFHTVTKAFKEGLDEARNEQVFKVDKMLQELQVKNTEPAVNGFGILNGAFTIAAGLSAANPILSGIFSVVAGSVGIAGSISDPVYVQDDTIPYEDQVYSGYTNTIEGMEQLMKYVFRPQRTCDVPFKHQDCNLGPIGVFELRNLPGNRGGDARSPLVNFFREGRFMREDYREKLDEVLKEYISWHRAALASRMLADQDFVIVINTDITDAEHCGNTRDGAWWDGENSRCYRTMRHVYKLDCPVAPSLRKLDDEGIKIAMDKSKWDMGWVNYYRSSYACAKNGGGESPTEPDANGGVPDCFFNMPVIEGTFTSWKGPGIKLKEVTGVNTLSQEGECGFEWACPMNSGRCKSVGKGTQWDPIEKIDEGNEVEYLPDA